ncbi:hypothetical protein EMCRGX_G017885 [Ephydatia muelleri]
MISVSHRQLSTCLNQICCPKELRGQNKAIASWCGYLRFVQSRDSEGCGYQTSPQWSSEGHVILKGVAIRFVQVWLSGLSSKLHIGRLLVRKNGRLRYTARRNVGNRITVFSTALGRNVGFLDLPETSWLNKSAKTELF